VSFSALWGVFYHSSAVIFTAKKNSVFLIPELANESTACKERANGETPVECWQQHLYEMKWFKWS